ncbi:MAG: TetR/AcrR family transcriptional regulator [Lactococcus lactis]|uniref:TetR/AcrR family transcriptional regulator n=1 Tax=Lactococcus lactis subsp. lactis TaxID=1360 RepID=A0A1V0NZ99_LACLL|nr:TetR/AcrR family transcriptional regulator [Lactococcus lactis]ARE19866.1 TetR/AcrR family transcriptional regulator [Lactococcus lactis subsp. lactis]MDN5981739.1 TetR/AcrR family transcriptional regulator [Lactococcus lactis]MDN6218705.1 TetR/AcrR family transcriptional regulator [Lactococcus lactis]MDN6277399.1 TetR/AcrR family transcriptional regulator [Lactococcus lactis]MDN6471808.1 TetR/AcrR family transcriptional regulator [Lactococcus lactis]
MSEEQTLNEVYADTLKKMENLTEKQKRVLQASLELFASQGFEATTSQQIAKRAGVSVGSVYHTFPTKQAILVAVLAPIFEGTMDTVANQFNDNTFGKGFESVEELVKVTIADRFYFADKNINVIRLMLGQMLVNSVFVEDLKKFFEQQAKQLVLPTIVRLQAEQKIKNLPIEKILQILFYPLATYIGKRVLGINNMSLEEEIEFATEITIKTLKVYF